MQVEKNKVDERKKAVEEKEHEQINAAKDIQINDWDRDVEQIKPDKAKTISQKCVLKHQKTK